MNKENSSIAIHEIVVLEKFEGEPLPENLVERVHLDNGKIVKVEEIANGEVINVKEVD